MLVAAAGQPVDLVTTLAGWVILLFVAAVGAVIVLCMASGKIDLSRLISEPNGDASTSRLQLLIFTFVVAVSLFLIVAATNTFPVVPQGVLVLLGISGSSYLVSKGIQFSSDAGVEDRDPAVMITPQSAIVPVGQSSVQQFKAEVIRQADQSIVWSVSPDGAGQIDAQGQYTAPNTLPSGNTVVIVTATSKADPTLADHATVTLR